MSHIPVQKNDRHVKSQYLSQLIQYVSLKQLLKMDLVCSMKRVQEKVTDPHRKCEVYFCLIATCRSVGIKTPFFWLKAPAGCGRVDKHRGGRMGGLKHIRFARLMSSVGVTLLLGPGSLALLATIMSAEWPGSNS